MDCEGLYKASKKAAEDSDSGLLPHSSKTRMIVKILRETEERGEGEKTIIFSQFTSMLDLIEPLLKREGIKFVRCECPRLSVVRAALMGGWTRRWVDEQGRARRRSGEDQH